MIKELIDMGELIISIKENFNQNQAYKFALLVAANLDTSFVAEYDYYLISNGDTEIRVYWE